MVRVVSELADIGRVGPCGPVGKLANMPGTREKEPSAEYGWLFLMAVVVESELSCE